MKKYIKLMYILTIFTIAFSLSSKPGYSWVNFQTKADTHEYRVFYTESGSPLSSMTSYESMAYYNNIFTYNADFGCGISNIKINYQGKLWQRQQSGQASYYYTFLRYPPYNNYNLCSAFDVILYYSDGTTATYSYDFRNNGTAEIQGFNSNGSIASKFVVKFKGSQYGAVWINDFGGFWVLNCSGLDSTNGDYFMAGTNLISVSYSQAGEFADQASVQEAVYSSNLANTAAQSAKISADNASVRVWYSGIYGGDSQSVADVAGYIANNQLPTIDTKIDNLNTSFTSIQNNISTDTVPPTISVNTVSGARATSGNSIQAVVDVSDSVSKTFTYSTDDITYTPLPGNKIITLPVSKPGANTITVLIKDEAGNTSCKTIIIRKI
ncbi:MAG: hypothetical protein ACOY46_09780 [Bacillota bacterium]